MDCKESTVLPPFSGDLRVDSELKFSENDFEESIKQFYAKRQLTPTDQLNKTPPYPTPHVLAQFANMAYSDYKRGEPEPPEGWKLLTTATNSGNGYFGTAYWHREHQQVVIAHQGTNIKNIAALVTDVTNVFGILKDLFTDYVGILLNKYVDQMSSASTFANKVVSALQEVQQEKKVSFELFFTGHSLGGWLAQITTFTTEYLEANGGTFLKKRKREEHHSLASSSVQDTHDARHSYHPHTVVFDSPGCKDMLLQMADKLDVRLEGSTIDLQHLDITSYLSAPNLINTCNSHAGTVYRIFIDMSDMGYFGKRTPLYNLATHRMDKILQAFEPKKGKEHTDDKSEPKIRHVMDWPLSAGLTGGAELNDFFEKAKHLNKYHPPVMDTVPSKVPEGYSQLRYQTKAYDECANSQSIFTQDEREFLERYRWLRDLNDFFKPEKLFCVIDNAEDREEAEQTLQNFELSNGSVSCPDARTLNALIPYVKRLVRLFPHIREKTKKQLSSAQIRNKVYQHETEHYFRKIRQDELEFNSDALGLTKFLTGDQQIWQLRMNDGDTWRGLTEVYLVLKHTSCTPNYFGKDCHTILELERLLTVNRMIKIKALLESMEKPHLLMIACGNNQTVNDELKNMLKELFYILKQKKTMKIFLTTQSEGEIAACIKEIATEILGEGFITSDEQLTWSDLIDSSQRKMLEKTVIFQGRRVALNQLTSAESLTNSFPLVDLLQETELRIGEETVPSAGSGYNEKYYIDRTFNHNIVIREDILSEKKAGKFADLLASTEQEFKELSQENQKKNVHWLAEDKSGELLWQQSQGNLQALRKYIDGQKSQSYALSGLNNLLQEAKHKRVMLIADTAGMGKSTVLTHLSKPIKKPSPTHWLVKIDLNDYTELLKAQETKKIDKKWVLEFVSKEVLKLESHLEKELFSKALEGNEISKVVVMVDGFDEVCPKYKETVLDILQVLKQTSLEQLWVTTRPHLRDDLEDSLQQLSYTLQPFSESEQVQFLETFWTENLKLESANLVRLQIYAEALIRKLAQSISDKDKEFTGIPLQTRMLAEAFEEDFRSFYLSEESEPELAQRLDLLWLYRLFIDRKYDIFYTEKSKTQECTMGGELIREVFFKWMQGQHQLLALEALFTEDHVTFHQTDVDFALSDEDLARIGIAQRNNEGKPQFVHRTFAEYCVAEFLIKQLTKKSKQNKEVQDFLLNEVLLISDYHVIRAFLDGFLGKSMPSNEVLEDYGKKLDEQWKDRKADGTKTGVTTALLQAATEDNANIIGFIAGSLKSAGSFNTLTEMMLAKDDEGQNAWYTAGKNRSMHALNAIWEFVKEVATTPQISLLPSQDQHK